MQLTSKIQFIQPNGTWATPNGATFNKYQVSFANGDSLGFLAKGEFKYKVGDDVKYEKNEQYNTGKVIYEKPAFTPKPQGNFKGQVNEDTQKFIIRQSSAASAANFYSRVAGDIDPQEVINLAREIENYVYGG